MLLSYDLPASIKGVGELETETGDEGGQLASIYE